MMTPELVIKSGLLTPSELFQLQAILDSMNSFLTDKVSLQYHEDSKLWELNNTGQVDDSVVFPNLDHMRAFILGIQRCVDDLWRDESDGPGMVEI
jgi:hypothetical protein